MRDNTPFDRGQIRRKQMRHLRLTPLDVADEPLGR